MERALRESTPVCAFCLVVIWIAYFIGVLDRDILFITNGVMIGLMIIAALLKRRNMHLELNHHVERQVRRAFPRGAIIRSGSNPEVTPEDQAVVRRIQSVYVSKLLEVNITMRGYKPTPDCHSCVICLVDFDDEEQTAALICDHFFHSHCLVDWLTAQASTASGDATPSCPTCRSKLLMTEPAMQAFIDEVCAPGFLTSQLSRRVHLVFNQYRQNSSGATTPDTLS